jgi:hypothetical protein
MFLCLFHESFSASSIQHTEIDDVCELQGRKNVEDTNCGSLEVLSQHFPGVAAGNYKKP